MKKKGFTFVELIIGSSIFIVILYSLITSLSSSKKMMDKGSINLNSIRNARLVIFKLFFEIQESYEIIKPVSDEKRNFILFRDSVSEIISIYVNDDNELVKRNLKTDQVTKLTKNVKKVEFANRENKNILIKITLYGKKEGSNYINELTLVDEVALNNGEY